MIFAVFNVVVAMRVFFAMQVKEEGLGGVGRTLFQHTTNRVSSGFGDVNEPHDGALIDSRFPNVVARTRLRERGLDAVCDDNCDDEIPDEILKNADNSKAIPPLYGALLKNEQDVHLLERLAFMTRREQSNK